MFSSMRLTKFTVLSMLLLGAIVGGITGAITTIRVGRFESISSSPSQDERPRVLSIPKTDEQSQTFTDEESQTIETVRRAAPAVVSILITKELEQMRPGSSDFPFDDFFQFGFPFEPFQFKIPQRQQQEQPPARRERREVGGGSGFLISADGLVLTNKHVVADTDAEYTVITNDGKRYSATVVGRDPTNDLAVVKIQGKDLPTLVFADSGDIKIGQTVIAIGNALSQYRNTVTKGVVSGIGRRVVAGDGAGSSEVLEEAIQTDAAINPGNSGGPLLNLRGEVIGINTAINRGGQLVGFAIPINSAKIVVESVRKHGRIVRPWLGVRYILINEQLRKENNLSVDYGALVVRGDSRTDLAVIPGSPADKAGIVENDIILTLRGVRVGERHSLAQEIAKYQPGDTVELKVLRKGKELLIRVKLEEFKE